MKSKRRIRVLIAKPGLDLHDRGAKVLVRTLRDSGMEVIYTGIRRTPEQIVETAIQEDVDVIGLSHLTGAHMTLFPKVTNLLKKKEVSDVLVIGGGVIPEEDISPLKKAGIVEIFGPGTPLEDIVNYINENVRR